MKQATFIKLIVWAIVVPIWVGLVFGSNYLMAKAGEPRAVWLMRDILGWM